MNCRQAQAHLQLRLDGELSARRQSALQSHLAQCLACREAAKQFSLIREAMSGLSTASDVGTRPMSSLDIVAHRAIRWQPCAAAAAMLAIFVAGWWATAGGLSPFRRDRGNTPASLSSAGRPNPGEMGTDPSSPKPEPRRDGDRPQPDPRSLVQVQFDSSAAVIAVPKPTRSPNVTILWVYPAIRTAAVPPSPSVVPESSVEGAHS